MKLFNTTQKHHIHVAVPTCMYTVMCVYIGIQSPACTILVLFMVYMFV